MGKRLVDGGGVEKEENHYSAGKRDGPVLLVGEEIVQTKF